MDKLTSEIIKYKSGRQKFERIFPLIAEEVYQYPVNEEHKGGFLAFFYPRIKKLCMSFEYKGIPFSHYLRKTIKWQYRTFLQEISQSNKLEEVLSSPDFCELYMSNVWKQYTSYVDLHEEEEINLAYIVENASKKERMRLLFLILREIDYLSPEYEYRIAKAVGIEPERLQNIFFELRKRKEKRKKKKERLQKKRNELNMRIIMLENQMMVSDDVEKNKLKEEIRRKKIRLNRLDKLISKQRVRAKHSDIAELLNLPKGTVDSGIYYIIQDTKNGKSCLNQYFNAFSSDKRACQGSVAHFILTG